MKKNKHNRIHYFIRIIVIVVISIIIGVNIYLWNSRRLLGDAMPMPSGYGVGVILSGSMEPTLSIDDLIIVKKLNNYQVDDIIVYQKNYELIVHRIVSINGNEIITKGDANNINDKPISTNNIKGKVILQIPNIGIIINFVRSPIGIFIILGLSIALYIYSNKKEKIKYELEIKEIQEEIQKLKQDN